MPKIDPFKLGALILELFGLILADTRKDSDGGAKITAEEWHTIWTRIGRKVAALFGVDLPGEG